ncbi:MAG: sigma-70 family RNA polymerase sigma factor [Dehalococcoidia bacterium]|uniref:sigma-70 family RNA polymerase sigma factor n=1 Tax=Candidatus Amarobacter glycogenicus TaxID=3140699 RepID=UPI001D7AF5E4|nr:sigma-70 family RNA polymerase sigma factor [Dehalococcoidia bacterium]MBK8561548.1 sigma-70 family RNA polymerase sigma factor [Dehalococcoidia bacterium]
MEQLADSSLIELAQGGDQHAFAELYSRYFDPVYDFVARMMRNRDEAADVAQDSFLKAMNALGGLQKGTSFKSWIFTIARNTALNRIEKNSRTRPLTFEGEDGEEVGFDVVDTDRFSDPEEAAQASAVASLVWEASAGLDPKQLSLLDLHLRQGLDSGEIADVMGVTRNNGYVMLNRLKKAVEESIGAFVMFKDGRQYCGELDSVLKKADIQGMSPETRKVVERHVALCPGCEERKKKLAPLAAFAAFGAIGAPAGAKAHILEGLMQQWPGSLAPAGAGGGTSRPNDRLRPAGPADGWPADAGLGGRTKLLVSALAASAAVLVALLVIPQSPLALLKDDHGSQQALFVPSETPGQPTESPSAGPVTPTPAPSATETPSSATPSPTGTVAGQGTTVPTATPTRTNTPAPTPGPGTPTFTPSPSATPTTVPTVTPTATVCVPLLVPGATSVSVAPGGTGSFQVVNETPCSATFSATKTGFGAAWLTVSGAGTIGPNASASVTVSVNNALVPAQPGSYSGTVLVVWGSNSFTVTVTTERTGTAPVISSATGTCGTGTSSWSVTASDDGSVVSVEVRYNDSDGTPRTVFMVNAGGNAWRGTIANNGKNGTDYRAIAIDNAGLQATLSFTPGPSCFS